MNEANFARVQTLSRKINLLILHAVHQISRDRMSERRHVHANLVRPARFENTSDVRVALVAAQHLIMRHRLFAVFLCDTHLFAVNRVSADRRVNRSLVIL